MTTPASSHPSSHFRFTPFLLACLLATWVIWGSTYLAIRFALESFPPFFQIGSRFLGAGLLLFAWARLARRAPYPSLTEWRNALVVGVLMLACGTGGCAFAEQTVGSGLVVTFVAVMPLLMTCLNLAFGIRPRRLEVVAMLVGFAGVALLARGEGLGSSPVALIALSVATCGWASGSVLSQRRLHLAPGAMGFASEMLCGGTFLLLLSALRGESPHWPPTALAAFAWAYLLTIGSIVGFNAYMVLLARAPVGIATSYSFVNPVIGLFLGVALGGETITRGEWTAVLFVLAGVLLLLWARARTTTAA